MWNRLPHPELFFWEYEQRMDRLAARHLVVSEALAARQATKRGGRTWFAWLFRRQQPRTCESC